MAAISSRQYPISWMLTTSIVGLDAELLPQMKVFLTDTEEVTGGKTRDDKNEGEASSHHSESIVLTVQQFYRSPSPLRSTRSCWIIPTFTLLPIMGEWAARSYHYNLPLGS
ncbi:hypothetical protein PROFUN_15781 [Planoprotostelium fungivorum]|uniref:Uncharacterized protein n=1 Tax=Planoprotostelium fungivorum TaxID=1890364 RepID=A0A2P6MT64_9EUKA|nr:hypothetical protein PROFUN_15781 [Planoprotostelium fungivorum]